MHCLSNAFRYSLSNWLTKIMTKPVAILVLLVGVFFFFFAVRYVVVSFQGRKYLNVYTPASRGIPASDDVTVVTAYFNLGRSSSKFTTEKYLNWAETFRYMENHLVVYTDSVDFHSLMMSLRSGKENTTIVYDISRNSSWAFQNENKVKAIIKDPGYPNHYPNTVASGYSCSQHAKYDVIERAARADLFKTKYIAWLDVGYFWDRKSKKRFKLIKPNNFNDSMVAFNKVYNVSMDAKPSDIFRNNIVWVGGGLVLGERMVLIRFANQFRRCVDYFLSQNLVNTDQQVIYAMFSTPGKQIIKPEVDIQTYWNVPHTDWFWLGYQMLLELDGRGSDVMPS